VVGKRSERRAFPALCVRPSRPGWRTVHLRECQAVNHVLDRGHGLKVARRVEQHLAVVKARLIVDVPRGSRNDILLRMQSLEAATVVSVCG
jgi:hypothetical protein